MYYQLYDVPTYLYKRRLPVIIHLTLIIDLSSAVDVYADWVDAAGRYNVGPD